MSDLPPDAADQPSPAPLSPGGSRRAIAIVVGVLLVAIIGGLFAWQALSDSDDGGGDDGGGDDDDDDGDKKSIHDHVVLMLMMMAIMKVMMMVVVRMMLMAVTKVFK